MKAISIFLAEDNSAGVFLVLELVQAARSGVRQPASGERLVTG
jgi:hypothetical protein